MKTLGASYNDEEYASFMAVWRYTGYLMGIPETILFRDAEEALKLYDVGIVCEPDSPIESVVMAHSLVNSAPLIAGMSEPDARRHLARYVYRISRGLIGKETADSLMYPQLSSFRSCRVVQSTTALRPHPGQAASGPSRRQQLREIHVPAEYFVVRRGRNPLHVARPRVRRRVSQVVRAKLA